MCNLHGYCRMSINVTLLTCLHLLSTTDLHFKGARKGVVRRELPWPCHWTVRGLLWHPEAVTEEEQPIVGIRNRKGEDRGQPAHIDFGSVYAFTATHTFFSPVSTRAEEQSTCAPSPG